MWLSLSILYATECKDVKELYNSWTIGVELSILSFISCSKIKNKEKDTHDYITSGLEKLTIYYSRKIEK